MKIDESQDIFGVVLAGGTGRRFWPLSRELSPKQLLSFFGTDSIVCTAVRHVGSISGTDADHLAILTNEVLAPELANTVRSAEDEGIKHANLLIEPLGRSTAPALALMATMLLDGGRDPIMLVASSNYTTDEDEGLFAALHEAVSQAASGSFAMLSDPHNPPTHGLGVRLCASTDGTTSVGMFSTDSPSAEWTGMLAVRASAYLQCLGSHPDGATIVDACRQVAKIPSSEWTEDSARDAFACVPSLSIERLLADTSTTCVALEVPATWHSLADFSALRHVSPVDEQGVVRVGNGIDIDTHDSVIFSGSRLVATLGLSDVVVVDTQDATLVANSSRVDEVGRVVELLQQEEAPELVLPRTSKRPWGTWTSLLKGAGFQVKSIDVLPASRVSLQSHEHRSEHWIVVRGTGVVTIDGEAIDVRPGRSVRIPLRAIHRIENTGTNVLTFVEVQVGEYLGEDDIVRHQDDYER